MKVAGGAGRFSGPFVQRGQFAERRRPVESETAAAAAVAFSDALAAVGGARRTTQQRSPSPATACLCQCAGNGKVGCKTTLTKDITFFFIKFRPFSQTGAKLLIYLFIYLFISHYRHVRGNTAILCPSRCTYTNRMGYDNRSRNHSHIHPGCISPLYECMY